MIWIWLSFQVSIQVWPIVCLSRNLPISHLLVRWLWVQPTVLSSFWNYIISCHMLSQLHKGSSVSNTISKLSHPLALSHCPAQKVRLQGISLWVLNRVPRDVAERFKPVRSKPCVSTKESNIANGISALSTPSHSKSHSKIWSDAILRQPISGKLNVTGRQVSRR